MDAERARQAGGLAVSHRHKPVHAAAVKPEQPTPPLAAPPLTRSQARHSDIAVPKDQVGRVPAPRQVAFAGKHRFFFSTFFCVFLLLLLSFSSSNHTARALCNAPCVPPVGRPRDATIRIVGARQRVLNARPLFGRLVAPRLSSPPSHSSRALQGAGKRPRVSPNRTKGNDCV